MSVEPTGEFVHNHEMGQFIHLTNRFGAKAVFEAFRDMKDVRDPDERARLLAQHIDGFSRSQPQSEFEVDVNLRDVSDEKVDEGEDEGESESERKFVPSTARLIPLDEAIGGLLDVDKALKLPPQNWVNGIAGSNLVQEKGISTRDLPAVMAAVIDMGEPYATQAKINENQFAILHWLAGLSARKVAIVLNNTMPPGREIGMDAIDKKIRWMSMCAVEKYDRREDRHPDGGRGLMEAYVDAYRAGDLEIEWVDELVSPEIKREPIPSIKKGKQLQPVNAAAIAELRNSQGDRSVPMVLPRRQAVLEAIQAPHPLRRVIARWVNVAFDADAVRELDLKTNDIPAIIATIREMNQPFDKRTDQEVLQVVLLHWMGGIEGDEVMKLVDEENHYRKGLTVLNYRSHLRNLKARTETMYEARSETDKHPNGSYGLLRDTVANYRSGFIGMDWGGDILQPGKLPPLNVPRMTLVAPLSEHVTELLKNGVDLSEVAKRWINKLAGGDIVTDINVTTSDIPAVIAGVSDIKKLIVTKMNHAEMQMILLHSLVGIPTSKVAAMMSVDGQTIPKYDHSLAKRKSDFLITAIKAYDSRDEDDKHLDGRYGVLRERINDYREGRLAFDWVKIEPRKPSNAKPIKELDADSEYKDVLHALFEQEGVSYVDMQKIVLEGGRMTEQDLKAGFNGVMLQAIDSGILTNGQALLLKSRLNGSIASESRRPGIPTTLQSLAEMVATYGRASTKRSPTIAKRYETINRMLIKFARLQQPMEQIERDIRRSPDLRQVLNYSDAKLFIAAGIQRTYRQVEVARRGLRSI